MRNNDMDMFLQHLQVAEENGHVPTEDELVWRFRVYHNRFRSAGVDAVRESVGAMGESLERLRKQFPDSTMINALAEEQHKAEEVANKLTGDPCLDLERAVLQYSKLPTRENQIPLFRAFEFHVRAVMSSEGPRAVLDSIRDYEARLPDRALDGMPQFLAQQWMDDFPREQVLELIQESTQPSQPSSYEEAAESYEQQPDAAARTNLVRAVIHRCERYMEEGHPTQAASFLLDVRIRFADVREVDTLSTMLQKQWLQESRFDVADVLKFAHKLMDAHLASKPIEVKEPATPRRPEDLLKQTASQEEQQILKRFADYEQAKRQSKGEGA
jgi:hypothetical protein